MTIHILPNFARSKGSQTLKFGQVVEYDKRNVFRRKSCRNEAERLAADLFLFFKKALHEVKANGLQLSFSHFR